jgi:hypothetical protein
MPSDRGLERVHLGADFLSAVDLLAALSSRRFARSLPCLAGVDAAAIDQHQNPRWTSWLRWSIMAILAAAPTNTGGPSADAVIEEARATCPIAGANLGNVLILFGGKEDTCDSRHGDPGYHATP